MQKNFICNYSTLIQAPVQRVWDALTNPAMVKRYFFGSELVTDWTPGGDIRFKGEWEGKPYEDKGKVLEYFPEKTLTYSYFSNWSNLPDSPENYLSITYSVQGEGNGTRLKITQSNYDEEKQKHSEKNWAMVIDQMKKLIE